MKKIVTSIAAATLISSVLMAASTDKHVGLNMVSMDLEDSNTAYGFNYGFDKLWNPVDSVQGFGLGMGMNFNFNQLDGSELSDYTYGFDASALVGYDFSTNGAPIKFKAGIGYDFEIITSDSYYSGLFYSAAIGYDFSKKYGMEAVYKTGDKEISTAAGTSDAFTTSTVSLNFVWRY